MFNNEVRKTHFSPGGTDLSDGNWKFNPSHLPDRDDSVGTRLWRIIWPGKFLILGAGFLCAAIALCLSTAQTPLYRAQTSIEIQDLNDNFLQLGDVDPVVRPRDNGDNYVQTQIEELSSNRLLSRVVDRLHLTDEYEKTHSSPSFLSQLKHQVFSPGVLPDTPEEMAIAEVRNNLDVSTSRASDRVVIIQYKSPDPKQAAAFTNTLAQEFVNQGIELRMQSADHLTSWLTAQLNSLRTKLQKSEDELQSYGTSAGLLFTDDKNSVAEAKLTQLQTELSTAQAERMAKQSKYELIAHAGPHSLAQLVESGPIHESQMKLTDAKQRLAQAESYLTPNHYKVKQLQAEVAELESALTTQERDIAGQIVADYEAARRREGLLQAAYDQQSRLVSTQDAKASHYNILKNEVQTNQQLYASTLQKVRNIGIASAMHASNIAIFDPAVIPTHPFEPKPAANAAVGLLSGLLLGCLYLFLRDRWDNRLELPGEIGMFLQIPELGAVPTVDNTVSLWHKKKAPLSLEDGCSKQEDGIEYAMMRDHFSQRIAHQYQDGSLVVDSFRAILASLVFSGGKEHSAKIVAVTSPSPREGKTTTATNLAVALASIGKQVLLIDGDLVKPRLREIFSLPEVPGLSDLLADSADTDHQDCLQTVDIPGLSILTSGLIKIQASKLLYSPRLGRLFEKLREQFDVVIVDTPPVLAIPDARLLSRSSDGVILVCRAKATDRESAMHALTRLQTDRVRVLGTILNDFDPKVVNNKRYYARYAAQTNNSRAPVQ